MPKTFTVNFPGNSVGPGGDGVCDTQVTAGDQCTLREAINESNANPDIDTIAFDTGDFAPTPHLIAVSSAGLPDITDQVVIDGTTQPGYDPAAGVIPRIDGGNLGLQGLKPMPSANGTVIRGLFFSRWGNAIRISGSSNTVSGNYFGVSPAGSSTTGFQNSTGVVVHGGSANVIGGTAPADRNVIGRNSVGIQVLGSHLSGEPMPGNADGTEIVGNYIGLRHDGATSVSNSVGLLLNGAVNTVIGSTAAPNVISSNTTSGIEVQNSAATSIQHNRIGTDVAGGLDRGNGQGIRIYDADGLAIADNLISGNSNGIYSTGAHDFVATIERNLIGTDATGSSAIANSSGGIDLASGQLGEVAVRGNTISGNTGNGMEIRGVATVTIQDNRIGTDKAGAADLGNTTNGVRLCDVHDALIGGIDAADANLIAGNNNGSGVELSCNSTENRIQGNVIGRAADRVTPLGNGSHGINIVEGSRNSIGGSSSGAANTIANNGQDGIYVAQPSSANAIRGNSIAANGGLGVDLLVNGVTSNDVGDRDSGANAGQNFPVLTEAGSDGTVTAIEGSLDSRAGRDYRIDFFKSAGCDGFGHGEGETYLGSETVTTDSTGGVGFTANLPAVAVGAGEQVTATATDLFRQDTSEFSQCLTSIGLPSATVDDVVVTEGSSGTASVTFTVNLSTPATVPASLRAATHDGTAASASDFTAVDTTVDFEVGDSSQTVTVPVSSDRLDEDDETFTLELSAPDSLILDDVEAAGTIADDDLPPTISINDRSVVEPESGTASGFLTISLSTPSSKPVSVSYATASGTATVSDYAPRALTTVTFLPGGPIRRTVSVPVKADLRDEPDQTVLVNLSAPTNAMIGDAQGVLTIVDTDPTPGITVTDVSAPEGNGTAKTFSFTVTLTNPSDATVSVQYATVDGSASAPSDYTAKAGALSFAPGIVSKQVVVSVKGGTELEGDETFFVQLHDPANAGLVDALGTGTIQNDDTP